MKKLSLAFVFGFFCVFQAHAEEPVELFVTITHADAQSQGIALVLVGQALEQKARVRLLLCADGGQLAVKSRESTPLKPRNITPKEMLLGLLKKGVQVDVCALFLPNSDWKASDLLDGIGVAKPNEVVGMLLQPNVRALTF